jgi:hypothetical protein
MSQKRVSIGLLMTFDFSFRLQLPSSPSDILYSAAFLLRSGYEAELHWQRDAEIAVRPRRVRRRKCELMDEE